MNRKARGHALIINVRSVHDHAPRTGTDIDCDKLHDLLKQLHFDNVVTYNDEDGLSSKVGDSFYSCTFDITIL